MIFFTIQANLFLLNTIAAPTENTEQVADAEANDADAAPEPDVDINEMVQRIEAKCANVREELSRMAVSEQYMRTKQAQLVRPQHCWQC